MSGQNTQQPNRQVSDELQQMGDVARAEPVKSELVDEPPRHRATFVPSRTAVPLPFQKWMEENDLAIMSAEIVSDGGESQLVVELQHRSVL